MTKGKLYIYKVEKMIEILVHGEKKTATVLALCIQWKADVVRRGIDFIVCVG